MKWQITAKSGFRRGASWDVGSHPLTLGRSLQCDITIADPTVSRRHCEIAYDGSRIRFRDLGSRNVTLINGRIVHECFLEVGDELALGTDSFIVTQAAANSRRTPAPRTRTDDTTISLGGEVSFERLVDTPFEGLHAASAQEMVRLYQFSQSLQRVSSEYDFAILCLASIEAFFPSPAQAIVCIQQSDGTLNFYPRGEILSEHISQLIADALQSGRSVLRREQVSRLRNSRQMCLSPLHSSEGCQAALAVLSKPPGILFNEDDLARLDLLSDVASLNLTALQRRAALSDSSEDGIENENSTFLGQSEEAVRVRNEIAIAAGNRLPALITGEAGTGKGLASQLIHRQSPEPRGPLVSVDCGVIAGPNFEQSLLGIERPIIARGRLIEAGFLDQANGGTLVLREIDRLTGENQRKLARILSQGSFVRIGSDAEVSFHGRIIATSRQDLERLATTEKFSVELLRMVSRQRIYIAPLRQRRSDIHALASYFLEQERHLIPEPSPKLLENTLENVSKLPLWRNVIELRQKIRRAARVEDPMQSDNEKIPPKKKTDILSKDPDLAPLEHAERTLISTVIRQCGGDMTRAAQILGIPLMEIQRIANSTAKSGRSQ